MKEDRLAGRSRAAREARPAGLAAGSAAFCIAFCAALASCAALSPLRLETGILGPTLLVVAGVHGDERSGPEAARALAAGNPALRGRVLVVPAAFPEALAAESRAAPGAGDMNRAFPGRTSHDAAERRAFALFRLIRKTRPDLVLDLHESDGTWAEGERPFLVVPSLPRAADLALAMLGDPALAGFSFAGSPPAGSLAAESARLLDLPCLIVEVPDALPLARRVELHLAAVKAAMAVLGMLDTGEEGRAKPCR